MAEPWRWPKDEQGNDLSGDRLESHVLRVAAEAVKAERDAAVERLKEIEHDLDDELRRAKAAEAERDWLKFYMEAANTPLMRDVLAERDALQERLREVERKLRLANIDAIIQEAQLNDSQAENAKLRAALRWIADTDHRSPRVEINYPAYARAALAEAEK